MTKPMTPSQILAHKRKLKADQMKRYRARQKTELQRYALREHVDGTWGIYEDGIKVSFDCSTRAVALEIATKLEQFDYELLQRAARKTKR